MSVATCSVKKIYPDGDGRRNTIPIHFMDWDEEELEAVRIHNLKYTIRSSKYPRTIKDPSRVILVINDTIRYSVHKQLLKAFSTKLGSLCNANPSLKTIQLKGAPPVGCPGAWRIFSTWLYTLDKVPLQDFTPLRLPCWRSRHLASACLLAQFLGATQFEKYLLRVLCKEVWEQRFPQRHLRLLADRMDGRQGMWWFAKAHLRWKESGERGELDPYRWRVEHWYSVCGRGGNWGCFHAMNVSGWGGVWERQRLLSDRMKWREEILEDDPPLRKAFSCSSTWALAEDNEGEDEKGV